MRILIAALFLAAAVSAAENSRVVIRTVGQFETANTAVYSTFLATKQEAVGGLIISVWLPSGARFLENVDLPPGVVYEGVADNVVQWTVQTLDRDTLLGPLTYRIKFDASRTSLPVAPPYSALYSSPATELLEDSGSDAGLERLAESGSITFDQRGTLDSNNRNTLVEVGKTGVRLFVPADAVSRSVTLTFRRLPVDDDKLPANAAGTWWCSLYQVTADPPVTLAKPAAYALPARRPLPPGITVRAFSSPDLVDWKEAPTGDSKEHAIGFGQFGQFGGCRTIPFGFTSCGFSQFGGGFGAFGFTDRTNRGVINGVTLAQQFGISVSPAQIIDGTSNTIIAILIGLR